MPQFYSLHSIRHLNNELKRNHPVESCLFCDKEPDFEQETNDMIALVHKCDVVNYRMIGSRTSGIAVIENWNDRIRRAKIKAINSVK